jgi:anthranilate synthase component II
MPSLLLIDNYDSFTFNIKSYFEELGCAVTVIENDEVAVEDIPRFSPTHILLSPGPGTPEDAGISVDVVKRYYDAYPILGVCLGHQCIATAFGGQVVKAPSPFHGKNSRIEHNNSGLFTGLPPQFSVTRYHSLLVDAETLPDPLKITAWAQDQQLIMGIEHRNHPVHGLQFHPEAILSEHGHAVFRHFLALTFAPQPLE